MRVMPEMSSKPLSRLIMRLKLPREFDLQLGPVEHAAVVIAGGPLQERLEIALDAASENGSAVGSNFDRLIEIEFFRREKKRECGDTSRCGFNRVATTRKVDAARLPEPFKERLVLYQIQIRHRIGIGGLRPEFIDHQAMCAVVIGRLRLPWQAVRM